MAHWLFKTEAETFSWAMQKKKGAKGEPWSGVRNWTAVGNMKKMKKGGMAKMMRGMKGMMPPGFPGR